MQACLQASARTRLFPSPARVPLPTVSRTGQNDYTNVYRILQAAFKMAVSLRQRRSLIL